MQIEFYYYRSLFHDAVAFEKYPDRILKDGITIEVESGIKRYMQLNSFTLNIRVHIFGESIPKSSLPHCMDTQYILIGPLKEITALKKEKFAELYYLAIYNVYRKAFPLLQDLGKSKLKVLPYEDIVAALKMGDITLPYSSAI
jgi:hypothetical protein